MVDTRSELEWSFLTNHGLAFLVIADDPHVRMRDIAEAIGVTERTAQRLVTDLVDAGYLHRKRPRRRNVYTVQADSRLRLPRRRDIEIGDLLGFLRPADTSARGQRSQPEPPGA